MNPKKRKPIHQPKFNSPNAYGCGNFCDYHCHPIEHNGDRVIYCRMCDEWWKL